MKNILIKFASKIDILNMNNIPIQKTIELMKNKDDLQSKVVLFSVSKISYNEKKVEI